MSNHILLSLHSQSLVVADATKIRDRSTFVPFHTVAVMSRQTPPPPPPVVNRDSHPSAQAGPSSVANRRAELDDELSEVDLGAQLDVRMNLCDSIRFHVTNKRI